jgi:hypothetical protein
VSEPEPEPLPEVRAGAMFAELTDEEKAHQHDDWQDDLDEYAVGVFCPFCGAVAGTCGHRAGG